jgi:hypothetical protein
MSEADMVEVIYGIMESGPTATMKKLLNESWTKRRTWIS